MIKQEFIFWKPVIKYYKFCKTHMSPDLMVLALAKLKINFSTINSKIQYLHVYNVLACYTSSKQF